MLDIKNAIVYDIETFPNVFTLHAQSLFGTNSQTWEISQYRDDRLSLLEYFNYLQTTQTPMIGFNSLNFDYVVIHFIYKNPNATVEEIYNKAMTIINGTDRFGQMIWQNDRFAPQIDLFKINHFDNKAKTTSLKALQFNMRSKTLVDMPVVIGTNLTDEQIQNQLKPYNIHDVDETKRFAHYSMKAIEFRNGLVHQFGAEVLNYNDTKIGSKILEQRLGDDICYDRTSGKKQPRQTVRYKIVLSEIIFPYIKFENQEFKRVLEWLKLQVLTPDDLTDPEAIIKTKGIFTGVKAHVGGLDFYFGTGGIHGSIPPQRLIATETREIVDIDVTGLYPEIAIKNRLSPEHLGDVFINEYAQLPIERAKYKKGTVQNASFKLGANGTYGNSNNPYSVFYDPQFTMTITINGQLMLCMLAEWLLKVPTLQIIQINTDGITYLINSNMKEQAIEIQKQWEQFTLLNLESVNYTRMFIKDVNNYIAEDNEGKLKQKGVYWHPNPQDYANSISESSPPAWHKDLSNIVSIRAAIAAMIHGYDPETFIRAHTDPFDFMCRIKVSRDNDLILGSNKIQNTTRYYVALNGEAMFKIAPPSGILGEYKRRNGLSDREYYQILDVIEAGSHDERIHTKNKSCYDHRKTAIQAGWKIAECNDASSFDFNNVNYEWYVTEAVKLII